MGQLRFYAPTSEKLLPHAVALAYVAGLEAIPWYSHNSLADGVLTIDRVMAESGNLYIPWYIPGIGERVLSTCTLMERDAPYCLVTELARGTLHRVRSRVAEMEFEGGLIPDPVNVLLRQALAAFIVASTAAPGTQQAAHETILLASQAIEVLTVAQVAASLDDSADRNELSTIFVGPVSEPVLADDLAEQFAATFHAVSIPFRWRQLQPTDSPFNWAPAQRQLAWSRAHGLRTLGGPLIQLDRLSLPDWVYAFEDDYEQFELAAIKYVRSTVQQFEGQVDIWVCTGRLNATGTIAFSEEQKLRLAVATLEAIRSVTTRTPIVISFDQPWAEYLAVEDFDLSPLHFADALVRADLGVAGVALEMNLGYWPGGTQPRDLLAISRHVDRWSLLGIPLLAYLTLPSQTGDDPQAVGPAHVIPRSPDQLDTPAFGQQQGSELVRLLLTKPVLHGIIWNQWSDADRHEFPHAGLLDAQGHPKPLLETLTEIRKKYLS